MLFSSSRSKPWPLAVFYGMIHISEINCFILFHGFKNSADIRKVTLMRKKKLLLFSHLISKWLADIKSKTQLKNTHWRSSAGDNYINRQTQPTSYKGLISWAVIQLLVSIAYVMVKVIVCSPCEVWMLGSWGFGVKVGREVVCKHEITFFPLKGRKLTSSYICRNL